MTLPTWRVTAGRAACAAWHLALGVGAGTLVAPSSVTAQAVSAAVVEGQAVAPDSRWTPFLGCWVEDPLMRPVVLVCVERGDAAAGVVLWTFVDGQPPLPATVVADGVRRPSGAPDCQGWQVVEWSSSGQRLFTGAEMTCAGQALVRLSGFATITPDGRWLDIQGVNAGGREFVRVRSYRRARSQPSGVVTPTLPPSAGAQPGALAASVRPLTVDEVKEAGARLSPFVLEAAVAETGVDFAVNGKRLIALADAGVPRRVIDLIVALGLPNRFVVERAPGRQPGTSAGISISRLEPKPAAAYSPLVSVDFGDFDVDEWWYVPGAIVVAPGDAERMGRAVDGLGYTQVRPRDDDRADSQRDASGDGGAGSRDTASGATASPEGYTSGASGADSGRTAQERPPG